MVTGLEHIIPGKQYVFISNQRDIMLDASLLQNLLQRTPNFPNNLWGKFNERGGCIVFFFLWLSFGNFELAVISFIPMAVSWIWILGLMSLFDVRFIFGKGKAGYSEEDSISYIYNNGIWQQEDRP